MLTLRLSPLDPGAIQKVKPHDAPETRGARDAGNETICRHKGGEKGQDDQASTSPMDASLSPATEEFA